MWNKFRIWYHKREVRHWQKKIDALFDEYNCGECMINHITGNKMAKYRDNKAWHITILRSIDPKFPGGFCG